MRKRYRMFRRNGVFYMQDNQSGRQESLHTRLRADAERLFNAKNEAAQGPMLNRDLGRVYLSASDPDSTRRTWSAVMEELRSHGRASTQLRYDRAMRDAALDGLRDKAIIETNAADLLAALRSGTRCTNHYLRRLHNLALGLGWLNWPLLAPRMWMKIKWRRKRGITAAEHEQVTLTECNAERRLYYELLWETGGSQSDMVSLTSDNIDWSHGILWFHRAKLKVDAEPARITIGPRLEALLRQLPSQGPLFPYSSQTTANDRAAEFRRRCRILKLEAVSLHCYRYAWAERAFEHGYPERYAQAALGQSSRAVHQAYAKGAKVICPSLEEYEKKVIPLPMVKTKAAPESRFKETATENG